MPSKYKLSPVKADIIKNGVTVGYVEYNNDWRNNWVATLKLKYLYPVNCQRQLHIYGSGPSARSAIDIADLNLSDIAVQLNQQFDLLEQRNDYELQDTTSAHRYDIIINGNNVGYVLHLDDDRWIAELHIKYKYLKADTESISIYGFGGSKASAIADALPKLDNIITQLKQQLALFVGE